MADSLRICFVSRRFYPTISGMSVYADNLLRELVRMGHSVTMVSQYRGDELGRRVYGGGPPPEVPGVRVVGLESLGEQDGGDFERDINTMVETIIAEHEREGPFDVIHAQYGYPTGLAAMEASRTLGVPNLVSIQGGDGHWIGSCCGTHKRAMLAVLGHAGALLIGSRSFADEVTENHATPLERFTIIPNAVDTRRFTPPEDRPLGTLSDEPLLLYHGRVDRRKGVLVLLDAFAALSEERPLRLAVSGIGPDLDAVSERARELGLEDKVEIVGYSPNDEVPAVYRRGELFVTPTFAEGFSSTILEAMSTGLPIVSTRAVGVVDCLRHEENALLSEVGEAESLAAELRRMLDDAALREHLAAQGLEEARTLYSWSAIAGRIVDVYRELLGTRPDTDWSADGKVEPCRFRETPHLL